MLAFQAIGFAPSKSVGWCAVAMGCTAIASVPHRDAFWPLLQTDRFLFVADVRLDNRDDLACALGQRDDVEVSDASLCLQALLRWDVGALSRIVGDWAFALFDRERQRLLLARDPLAQRPLHFARVGNTFLFASQPKGLHGSGLVQRRADPVRIAQMIANVPADGTRGFYQHVERLPSAHLLDIRPDQIEMRRYWHPPRSGSRRGAMANMVGELRHTLDQATSARLRGAGPTIATHLSGGWDSSAVAATAARLVPSDTSLLAYTAVPRQGAQIAPLGHRFGDERDLAVTTASQYPHIQHRFVENTGASPFAIITRMAELYDRPVATLCNHVWMGRIRTDAVQAGARVLLTGEIGNVTISAAPTTLLADLIRQRRWSAWARESIAAVKTGRARVRGVLASSVGPWLPAPIWQALAPLSSGAQSPPVALTAPWKKRLRAQIAGAEEARRQLDFDRMRVSAFDWYDHADYRKGAMRGWGIDERDPTADRRLADFMLSLPLDMFMSRGQRRPLARAALSDRVPAAVLDARGKGLQAADWMDGLLAHMDEAHALIDRIAASPQAADVIDVPLLRGWMRDLPQADRYSHDTAARYRAGLMVALSTGSFLADA